MRSNSYGSANFFKSRRSMMRDKKNAYRILVGKPEGKILLGRPKRGWVDNIKLDLRDME
jgi:hypothetical protein